MANPFSYVLCSYCGVSYVDVRFLLKRTSKLVKFVTIKGQLSARNRHSPHLSARILNATRTPPSIEGQGRPNSQA
jgi:hypothetical protein